MLLMSYRPLPRPQLLQIPSTSQKPPWGAPVNIQAFGRYYDPTTEQNKINKNFKVINS